MLKLNSLLLHSDSPKSLGDFYSKVLDSKPSWQEGEFIGFETGTCNLAIGPHSQVRGKNNHPERILINFETDNVKADFMRIKELGAKVIAEPYHMDDNPDFSIATLADPDGNYFQVISPMKH